ncbi:MAG: T9SS type A sorting domain-containing protein [Ignavibacteria bacterium]
MKYVNKAFFIVLSISLFHSFTFSQWITQNSTTTNSLRAVQVFTPAIVYACGELGTVIKSTNGGANWVTQTPPLVGVLTSMFFFNSTTGFIGSTQGNIMKTTNGGTNWQAISIGSGVTNSITFPSTSTGYCGGSTGFFRKTTNAGVNWNDMGFVTSDDITSLFFLSDNTGWLCTNAGNSGQIKKTTNGGVNWVTQASNSQFFSLFFIDASTGLASSFAQVKRTTNGGTNWVNVTTVPPVAAVNSLTMVTPAIGFAACSNGNVIKTTDGGLTWIENFTNQTSSLRDVGFLQGNPLIGFAVGLNGRVLKTTTGGGNFTPVEPLGSEVPENFSLSQNYPNPFNPSTNINFSIPVTPLSFGEGLRVSLTVYNVLGKQVALLVDQSFTPGNYSINFDASSLSTGTYFYRLIAGEFSQTNKMVLIK